MLKTFNLWQRHGKQYIPDIQAPRLPDTFRGKPVLNESACATDCNICVGLCPTQAISLNPLQLDAGKCTFCGLCERACPTQAIQFSPDYQTGTNHRAGLVYSSQAPTPRWQPDAAQALIQKYFGKSLKLRQVSAGGCNGCESELNATMNVNFDMGRFGIDFVASPRHADGIVISGPISSNMAAALALCYDAVPAPKLVILFGTCAISGGIFSESDALDRRFIDQYPVHLYIPGCPPHPLTFLNGLLDYLNAFLTSSSSNPTKLS